MKCLNKTLAMFLVVTIVAVFTVATIFVIVSNNALYADDYESNYSTELDETVTDELDETELDELDETEIDELDETVTDEDNTLEYYQFHTLNFSDFLTKEQINIETQFMENFIIEFIPDYNKDKSNTPFDTAMSYLWHFLDSNGSYEGSDIIMHYDNMPFDETITEPMRIAVKMLEVTLLDFFETTYLARGYIPGGEQQRANTWFRRPLVLDN